MVCWKQRKIFWSIYRICLLYTSVAGCDNLLISGMRGIDLTTVEHFAPRKGEDACLLLLEKIEEKREKRAKEKGMIHHIEYEPCLIVRGSTSYPKKL